MEFVRKLQHVNRYFLFLGPAPWESTWKWFEILKKLIQTENLFWTRTIDIYETLFLVVVLQRGPCWQRNKISHVHVELQAPHWRIWNGRKFGKTAKKEMQATSAIDGFILFWTLTKNLNLKRRYMQLPLVFFFWSLTRYPKWKQQYFAPSWPIPCLLHESRWTWSEKYYCLLDISSLCIRRVKKDSIELLNRTFCSFNFFRACQKWLCAVHWHWVSG